MIIFKNFPLRHLHFIFLLFISIMPAANAAVSGMHRLFVPTQTGTDLWGVADDEGHVLIPPIYTFISNFGPGIEFPISVQSADGKWGYVSAKGDVVLKPTLQQARSFTEDGIARYQQDEKWGFIRPDGSYLTPPIYDAASYFSNGFAAVKRGDAWTYIDTSGKQIFDQEFVVAGAFSSAGVAAVAQGSSKKIGFINQQGKWIVKPAFDEVRDFSESGHIGVRVGRLWGIVDAAGKWIVKPKYYELGYFDDGEIAQFDVEYGHSGLITDSGKVLLDLGKQSFYELNYENKCGIAYFQYDSPVIFYSLADGKKIEKLNQHKYEFVSALDDQCRMMVLFADSDKWSRLEANGTQHNLPNDVLEPYFDEGGDSTTMAYAEGKYVPVILRNRNLAYVDYDGVIALRAETIKQANEDVLVMRDASGKELWRQNYAANTLIANGKHLAFINKGQLEVGYITRTQEQLSQIVEKLKTQTPTAFTSDEKNLNPGSGDSFGVGVQLAYVHYNYADHASTYWRSLKYPDFAAEFQETKATLETIYGPAVNDMDAVDATLEMNEIYGEDIAAWNLGENILVLQSNRYEDGDIDYWGVLNLLILPTPESTSAVLNLPIIPLADVNLSPHSDPSFIVALKEIYDKLDRDSRVELHPLVMAVLTQLQSGKPINADDYIRTQYALLQIAYFEDDEPQIGTEAEFIVLSKNLMNFIEDHGLGKDLLTAVGQFRIDTYLYAANNVAWMLRDTDPSTALNTIERAVPFLMERNSDEWDTYIRVLVSAGQQPKAFEVVKRILDENPWHAKLADFYDDKAYRQWLKKHGGRVINSESLPTSADTVRNKQDIAVHNESARLAIAWFSDIVIVDLVTGKKTLEMKTTTYDPFVFRFNHDGSKLTSSGWEVTYVWDTHNGKQLTRQSVPDGNSELAGVSASGSYYFYDQDMLLTNALLIKSIGSQRNQLLLGNISNGNISPDNRFLAVGVRGKNEPSLKIIDLEKTKVVATLHGDEADPYDDDLFFVNGNKRLLVRDYSDFHLWNLATKKLEYTWDTDDFGVDAMAATDSLLLIVDDNNFNKRVWTFSEKPKGNVALPIPQYAKGGINSVVISADQKSYALVTHNEEENLSFVFVMDMQSDKIISQYVSSNPFFEATFANNDQYLVLDGYPVEVIEASSGKQIYAISR